MSPRLFEILRHLVRWLAPAALLALVPKCLLCVMAYAGIGVALGLGGPEMCGAPAGSTGLMAPALMISSLALGLIGFFAGGRRKDHPRPT
jgi:hypothetical protein